MRDKPESSDNVTFAFGHAVGLGFQLSMQGFSLPEIYIEMFIHWQPDLYDEEERSKKSFFYAMAAVQKFHTIKNTLVLSDGTDLSEYDLAYFDGLPAVELSFRIAVIGGFKYRGFVDAVLVNRITKQYLVLEIKTTSLVNIDEAMYKNSAQALGYSVVLDKIAGDKSSYRVLYIVYKSGSMDLELMSFNKSFTKRADWIRDLLMDINHIGYYNAEKAFPMHGESCYSFFRQCEHFNTCQMSDKVLIDPAALLGTDDDAEAAAEASREFQIELTLADLIEAQLNRV